MANRPGYDPPAKVRAMVTNIEPGTTPVRVRVCRYTAQQAVSLRDYADRLVALGNVFRNPTSTWRCAPLLLPKPPDTFRFTLDLRPVSKVTVPEVWPMPHLESELARVAGSTCFTTFDILNSYWLLPVDPVSAEVHSFFAPDGVFTANRVLHGARNAVAHFQSAVQEVTMPIRGALLQWLDDLLLFTRTEAELIVLLRQFFGIYAALVSNYTHESASCLHVASVGVDISSMKLASVSILANFKDSLTCTYNWG
jgi:hypothetical protein